MQIQFFLREIFVFQKVGTVIDFESSHNFVYLNVTAVHFVELTMLKSISEITVD